MIRLLSLLSLFLGPLVTSAKDLNLEIPLLPHPVKISLPENFDPSKKHPTFFYYHGSGGRPTTELMRRQTGPDDWIIVGMTYTDGGRATLSQEPLTEEIKAFQRVRQQLLRQHASDPDRLYVGGFSLGGWHSDLMLQSVPSLRGGIILGAGHARRPPGALSKYADQKSVHIGVGRGDPNYLFALRAFLHHRKLGGELSMEVWPNLAHAYPRDGSDSMRQWLKLRVSTAQTLAPTAQKELSAFLQEAKSLPFIAQWDRLREVQGMPYFALTSPSWQTTFKEALSRLEASPALVNEVRLYKEHRRLHHQEITDQSAKTLRKVNAAYLQLSRKFPKTRQAKLMQEDYKRTLAIIKQIKVIPAEKKPTTVPFGTVPDRRIPRNPLVR